MDTGAISQHASLGYQQFISLNEFFSQQSIKPIIQPNGKSLTIRLLFSHVLALGSVTSARLG
jgi:hypothetical protein